MQRELAIMRQDEPGTEAGALPEPEQEGQRQRRQKSRAGPVENIETKIAHQDERARLPDRGLSVNLPAIGFN